jgi:hypothetical protein
MARRGSPGAGSPVAGAPPRGGPTARRESDGPLPREGIRGAPNLSCSVERRRGPLDAMIRDEMEGCLPLSLAALPVGPVVGPNAAVLGRTKPNADFCRALVLIAVCRHFARSLATNGLLHTREVAGSKPAAPILRMCVGPDRAHLDGPVPGHRMQRRGLDRDRCRWSRPPWPRPSCRCARAPWQRHRGRRSARRLGSPNRMRHADWPNGPFAALRPLDRRPLSGHKNRRFAATQRGRRGRPL